MRKLIIIPLILFFLSSFSQTRTPAYLQSLVDKGVVDLWLEPDYGVLNKAGTTAAIGDSIGTITDKAGNWNATQSTAGKYPVLRISEYSNTRCFWFNNAGYIRNTSFTGFANKVGQATIVAFRTISPLNGPLLGGGASGQGFPMDIANGKTFYIGSYNYSLGTYNGIYSDGNIVGAIWNGQHNQAAKDRFLMWQFGETDTMSSESGTPPMYSGTQSTGYTLGGASYGSEAIDAEVFAVLHFIRTPSQSDLDSVYSYLRTKYFAKAAVEVRVITEGDSITEGYPDQLGANKDHAWPAVFANMLPGNSISPDGSYSFTFDANKRFLVRNVAARGETIATMSGQAASQCDGKKDLMNAASWVTFEAGTNDMSAVAVGGSGATGAATYSAYKTYCLNRRANGFKVCAFTVLDRRDQGVYQTTFNTERAAFNDSIRANWQTFADAFADVSADPRLDDATDATYFYSGDLVHLTDAGQAAFAEVTYNAIYNVVFPTAYNFDMSVMQMVVKSNFVRMFGNMKRCA